MISSLHFGRTFWLDDDNEFCSAPTFKDGSTDWEMWDYVSEWEEITSTDLDKLFHIHRHLVTTSVLKTVVQNEYKEAVVWN